MKKAIEINRDDYEYMGNMPMDGWFWEFVKRNMNYIQFFNEIEDLANELIIKGKKTKKTTHELIADKFLIAYRELGVQLWSDINVRDLKDLDSNCFLTIQNFYGRKHRILPRPDAKYIDIQDYMPNIRGSSIPIKVYSYDKLMKEVKRYSAYPFKKAWVKSSAPYIAVLQALTPITLKDSLYIGIPLTVKLEELEKLLLEKIRENIRRKENRIRSNKWKFFLIAFDLKLSGCRYKEITDALVSAYTYKKLSKEIDEKSVQNYYKAADALINGGYKKYLYT